MAGTADTEPFSDVTIGAPVKSFDDAQAWYLNFFGSDVEVLRPIPGVAEFKAASGVWF